MNDYPPGSLGYERRRLLREMHDAVEALPLWCRWYYRRRYHRALAVDARISAMNRKALERVGREAFRWDE